MAKNVYIKQTNDVAEEQKKYINELKEFINNRSDLIQKNQKHIKTYEDLQKKLETIHAKLYHDILIPISEDTTINKPLCFVEGKIMHTNEIFIPIGTKYYHKSTNVEAIKHCRRKTEDIEEEILEYEDDKKRLIEKLAFMQESLVQPGQVEIIEEYDEDYEVPGSRRHRNKSSKHIPESEKPSTSQR